MTLFGLDRGDYYEPTDLFGGVNTFLMGISDDIQSGIDNLLNNVSSNIPFVGQALAAAGSKIISGTGIAGFPTTIAQKLGSSNLNIFGKFF